MRIPIDLNELSRRAPELTKYYQDNKAIIVEQTDYNERIIGQETEFYALARVGDYSYSNWHVAFRDNTKWVACVISKIDTDWGGLKRPLFQNHAVTISQNPNGDYISEDEAHYICGIINAPIVAKYVILSSDSRTFPIRPRIYIPVFNCEDEAHIKISQLSKIAHQKYNDEKIMSTIDAKLDELYLAIANTK